MREGWSLENRRGVSRLGGSPTAVTPDRGGIDIAFASQKRRLPSAARTPFKKHVRTQSNFEMGAQRS
jgi:hypothetical protein